MWLSAFQVPANTVLWSDLCFEGKVIGGQSSFIPLFRLVHVRTLRRIEVLDTGRDGLDVSMIGVVTGEESNSSRPIKVDRSC